MAGGPRESALRSPRVTSRSSASSRGTNGSTATSSGSCYPTTYGRQAPLRSASHNPKSTTSSAETDFKKRLRRLYDWSYIHRALDDRLGPGELHLGNELYEIWDEGLIELEYHGGLDENLTGHRIGSHATNMAHGLMVCSAVASIELGIKETPGTRFIPPSEILATAPPAVRVSKDPWKFPQVTIHYQFPGGSETECVSQRADSPIFGIEYNMGDTTGYASSRSKPSAPTASGQAI